MIYFFVYDIGSLDYVADDLSPSIVFIDEIDAVVSE